MNACFLLIVFLNTILGWFLVTIIFKFLIKTVRSKINELNVVNELEPFLNQRLEGIIQRIAAQIPMGNMLLSGNFGQKMQSKVKDEVVEALPDLKPLLVKRMEEELDSNRKKIIALQCLGALVGAFTGLLEVLILFWFCR